MTGIVCGYGGKKVDFTQKYIVGPLLYFYKKAQAGLPVNAGKERKRFLKDIQPIKPKRNI